MQALKIKIDISNNHLKTKIEINTFTSNQKSSQQMGNCVEANKKQQKSSAHIKGHSCEPVRSRQV